MPMSVSQKVFKLNAILKSLHLFHLQYVARNSRAMEHIYLAKPIKNIHINFNTHKLLETQKEK